MVNVLSNATVASQTGVSFASGVVAADVVCAAIFLLLLRTDFRQDCRGYRDFPSIFSMLKDVNVLVFTLAGLDYLVPVTLVKGFWVTC